VRHARLARDLVVEIELELSVGGQMLQERQDVARVHLARVRRHRRREVGLTDDRDAPLDDGLPGLRQLDIPTGLGGEVDDHGPRPHRARCGSRHEHGRRLSGDERGRDDGVRLGHVAGDQLLLALVLVLGQRHCVAADPLRALDVELEERRAEALDLLLDDRPHIEGRHDGSQAAGGRDRLEAGDAGSEDEDASRCNRPGGRRQHRKELAQVRGGEQHCLVSGDGALRRECIHRLGARDSRDRVHREGRHLSVGEGAHALRVGQRLQ
jgi:hypothetical protein